MSPVTTVPLEDATDTEITLGTGKMLALFFGLVILCAIFFGMGFTMGKSSVRSAPELCLRRARRHRELQQRAGTPLRQVLRRNRTPRNNHSRRLQLVLAPHLHPIRVLHPLCQTSLLLLSQASRVRLITCKWRQ